MSNEAPDPARRALLLVVSSPSGAGKTTLTRRLLEETPGLTFSVSYTTRPARDGEHSGVDYHFVDDAAFDRMVEKGRFAEWAPVHRYRYGTAVETIDRSLAAGTDVIFDIDFQGGRQLMSKYPQDAVMVFVLPPDMITLSRRLRSRATDEAGIIRDRLANAVTELGHYHAYRYLIVNDDLERAYGELVSIYRAEACRRERRAAKAEALIAEASQVAFLGEISEE